MSAKIHNGCVNIETWDIDANVDLANTDWVDDPSLEDTAILANCELELTSNQARQLADALLEAASLAE